MSVNTNTVGNKVKRTTSSHTAQVSIDISSFTAKQQTFIQPSLNNENYCMNQHSCQWRKSYEEEHTMRTEVENLYIMCLKVTSICF